MNPRRNENRIVFASLLLCCSTGWAQAFSTSINGTANTCTPMQYSETGTKFLSDKIADSCPDGSASAASTAGLVLGEGALATAQNGAGATARGMAIQTATLIPPKGYTRKTVTFSFTDTYKLSLDGVGPGTGKAEICLGFLNLGNKVCPSIETNGVNNGTMHGTFVVTKLPVSGFILTIGKQAYAEAAGNAPPPPTEPLVQAEAATTSHPKLILPKGWKCKYDSGTPCP